MTVDFIGIGAKKAATSWIAECLNEHPDIFVPSAKEVHFFTKHFGNGVLWYEEQFEEAEEGQVKGEYSTSYLKDENVPKRIHEAYPNAKLIVSLRNPVDRALSHIRHRQSKGILSKDASVKDVVEDKPEGGLIEIGKYAKNLKRYLGMFDKKQLHVILYDDIKSNPKKVVKELYAFLGVDNSFVPQSLSKTFNTSSTRTSSLFKLKNRLYHIVRNLPFGKTILSFVRPITSHFQTSKKQEYSVSIKDKEFLREQFVDDIEELEQLLSYNLDIWKKW